MPKESNIPCPPRVLLTVEKLYLRTIRATIGFNNVLKTFIIDGLASSLKGLQDNLNLARRTPKNPDKRIKCLEDAIINLDTFKSYTRIALEYGKENKSGGLTYTASAEITDLVMDIEKQINSWKLGTENYRNGSGSGTSLP